MKDTFKSFVIPTPAEIEAAWADQKTLFVFDANVLLNLYGFEEQTRKDFFSTAIRLTGRAWIPYHAGLEYNRQRLNVIRKEKKSFRDLNTLIDKLTVDLTKDLQQFKLKEKFPEVSSASELLVSEISAATLKFKNKVASWDQAQADVRSEDLILNTIHEITQKNIGSPPPNQKWLDDLVIEGNERYEKLIPPGFKDLSKDSSQSIPPSFQHNGLTYERKFGDLIIWKQLIEHAGEAGSTAVFFITDDAKDDWWSTIDSGGNKTIGPHESLKSEIYRSTDVKLFHMYSTSDFLKNSKQILKVDIQDSSINDATAKNTELTEHDLRHDQIAREMDSQYVQWLKMAASNGDSNAIRLANHHEMEERTKRLYYGYIPEVLESMKRASVAATAGSIKESALLAGDINNFKTAMGDPYPSTKALNISGDVNLIAGLKALGRLLDAKKRSEDGNSE